MKRVIHDIREAKHVEKPAVDYAKSEGWIELKVGYDGWPDRLFMRDGRVVWWEFKATSVDQLRTKQKLRITELKEQGIEVYFGHDLARFRRIMRRPLL